MMNQRSINKKHTHMWYQIVCKWHLKPHRSQRQRTRSVGFADIVDLWLLLHLQDGAMNSEKSNGSIHLAIAVATYKLSKKFNFFRLDVLPTYLPSKLILTSEEISGVLIPHHYRHIKTLTLIKIEQLKNYFIGMTAVIYI